MRGQTYGDKQREAQRRKKEEQLREKSNPDIAPTSETPTNAANSNQASNKSEAKDTPSKRSA